MILEDNNFERAYESVAGDKYKLLKNYIPDEGIGVFSKSWIADKKAFVTVGLLLKLLEKR